MVDGDIKFGATTYFTRQELACPSTGIVKLAPRFSGALLDLRLSYDHPMTVNSCCRSMEHNQNIGGHEKSLHIFDFSHHKTGGTAAIDIAWPRDSSHRAALVKVALDHGWSVGVARWGVHLDRRDIVDLPQMVFGYGG
jgi:hypothetical protein